MTSTASPGGKARFKLQTHSINRLRQTTGLVLFAYVTTHFLNHACGLISLSAQTAVQGPFLAFWHFMPVTVLLCASAIIHILIALRALYVRKLLKMPVWQAAQLILGFLLPFLIIEHIIGTRVAHEIHGTNPTYNFMMLFLWNGAPFKGFLDALALMGAWIHGCIGLHYWLRLKSGYRKLAPLLLSIAVLIPVLALLGFANAGREAAVLAMEEDWLLETLSDANQPNMDAVAMTSIARQVFQYGFAVAIALILLARAIRAYRQSQVGRIRVTYPDDTLIEATPGMTVLEISRHGQIPHASVCGGRGRCSTCRVRISAGMENLAPPDDSEKLVLSRVNAPPTVRLACQIRPVGNLQVAPLVSPSATSSSSAPRPQHLQGEERNVAILFADMRGFTSFSEDKLPYDVVFLLNRYFSAMGTAVEDSGGHVDKFIGDGVMALFGVKGDASEGCRGALEAARQMARRLKEINIELENDLNAPLRIGIGIHTGSVVIGEMGHGDATSLTAIGDAVNTASRLETMTKEHGVQLIVSEDVCSYANVDLSEHPTNTVEVRGRKDPIVVRLVEDAFSLPSILEVKTTRGSSKFKSGKNLKVPA